MAPITFRTAGDWGAGKGSDLTPAEVDGNFWALLERVIARETGFTDPTSIESIEIDGAEFTVTLTAVTDTEGATFGPFPLPVTVFRWRGEWQPATSYSAHDLVYVRNDGLFYAELDHVSAATFDEAAETTEGALYDRILTISATDLIAARSEDATNYTLALSDAKTLIQFTGGADVTVPPASSAAFAIGTEIAIRQSSAGTVALIEGSGVTVNPVEGKLRDTAFLGAVVHLKKVGADEWDIWGDLAAGDLPTETEPPATEVVTGTATGLVTETETATAGGAATEAATEAVTEAVTATETATEAAATETEEVPTLEGWYRGGSTDEISQSGPQEYTFAAQPLGPASATRTVVLVVTFVRHGGSGAEVIDYVTIGGVEARRAVRSTLDTEVFNIEMWTANVPTGTTGDIVLGMSDDGLFRFAWGIYSDDQIRLTPSWVDSPGTGSDDPIPTDGLFLPVEAAGGQVEWPGAIAAGYIADTSEPPAPGLSGLDNLDAVVYADYGSLYRPKLELISEEIYAGPAAIESAEPVSGAVTALFSRTPLQHAFYVGEQVDLSTVVDGNNGLQLATTELPIGTPEAGRLVVIAWTWVPNSGTTDTEAMQLVPNVTGADPVDMVRAVRTTDGAANEQVEIWYGVVPEGDTADVYVQHSSSLRNITRQHYYVYAVPNAAVADPVYVAADEDHAGGIAGATDVTFHEPGAFYVAIGATMESNTSKLINMSGAGQIDMAGDCIPNDPSALTITSMVGSGIAPATPRQVSVNTEMLAVACWYLEQEAPTEDVPTEDPPTETVTEPVSQVSATLEDFVTGESDSDTFATTVSLGTADADRMIVVGLGRASFANTVNVEVASVSIGAVSLTRAVRSDASAGLVDAEIWYGNVPTGTSDTLTVAFTAPGGQRGGEDQAVSASIYSVIGLGGMFSPLETASNSVFEAANVSTSVNQSGAFAIVAAAGRTIYDVTVPVSFSGVDPDTASHSVPVHLLKRLHGRYGSVATQGEAQTLKARSEHSNVFGLGNSLQYWRFHIAAAVWPNP